MFDCIAEGVPMPNMSWWRESEELQDGDRIMILPNNSLRYIEKKNIFIVRDLFMYQKSISLELIKVNNGEVCVF